MKDMGLWDEGDWIAVIALVVLGVFLTIGGLIAGSKKPEFAGHPKGLYMLFFAEMWERFSYYGMRAILIFYLTQHWLFSDSKSNLVYGAYTSLVYITPVLGGYLADRYLGQRKAELFGGLMLLSGVGLLAAGDQCANAQENAQDHDRDHRDPVAFVPKAHIFHQRVPFIHYRGRGLPPREWGNLARKLRMGRI